MRRLRMTRTRREEAVADVALGRELIYERRESLAARWYREHTALARGLLSLVVVATAWEVAARSGRWPLIFAPLTDIGGKLLRLASTGELQRHALVSLNEFLVGFV